MTTKQKRKELKALNLKELQDLWVKLTDVDPPSSVKNNKDALIDEITLSMLDDGQLTEESILSKILSGDNPRDIWDEGSSSLPGSAYRLAYDIKPYKKNDVITGVRDTASGNPSQIILAGTGPDGKEFFLNLDSLREFEHHWI